MRLRLIIFFLVPVLLCAGANEPSANSARGHLTGDYTLTLAGHFTGKGTANVTSTVSLTANVKTSDGAAGTLVANDLTITNSTFKGVGTIMGLACTVQGRLDLPAAADDEQTHRQSITARITGTFKDAAGNVGRLVAVQNNPSTATGGDGSGGGGGGGGGGDGGHDGPR